MQAAHRLFEKLQRTGTAQGGADLVISDQRCVFSDEYENLILLEYDCFVEISGNNHLSGKAYLTLADLKRTPCILIAPAEQREGEAGYYRDILHDLIGESWQEEKK